MRARAILKEIDDKKLENIAKNLGTNMPKAETMFWFKKLNLEAILEVFSLYGKYSGLHTNEIEINEKHCIITFHHELGKKWSIFLNHFISHFIKSSLGIMPKTDVTNGLVMVSFALDH